MPSIVTHHLFAKEVFPQLNKKIKNRISLSHFYIFAQSFDNLFYYKFLTPWKGQEIRELGSIAQKKNVNLYFKSIIQEIERNSLEEDTQIIAYLYGSICHYVLDYHCHPFVFYHTGNAIEQKKYRGLHEKMEVNLDAYMYQKKEHKDLYKASLSSILLPKVDFSNTLIHTMDNVYRKTFQKENMGYIYEQSTKTGNFLLKYGVTDRSGLKKLLYKIKDMLSIQSTRRYEYLSFHVKRLFPEYQNTNHEIWNNPVDKNITSNKSFEDLYEDAKKVAVHLIESINYYLETKEDLETLLKEIGNNSYSTGLPCEDQRKLKYFKF